MRRPRWAADRIQGKGTEGRPRPWPAAPPGMDKRLVGQPRRRRHPMNEYRGLHCGSQKSEDHAWSVDAQQPAYRRERGDHNRSISIYYDTILVKIWSGRRAPHKAGAARRAAPGSVARRGRPRRLLLLSAEGSGGWVNRSQRSASARIVWRVQRARPGLLRSCVGWLTLYQSCTGY